MALIATLAVWFWIRHPGTNSRMAASTRSAAPVAVPSPQDPSTDRSWIGFRDAEHLVEHFHKHGAEFHAASAMDYLRLAQQLRDGPVGGDILEAARHDGTITRFDRRSGAFLAVDGHGMILTFFRPNDGEAYFRRQLNREPSHS